jgi:hypothetical protein
VTELAGDDAGQVIYDRAGSMIELLEDVRAFLVKAGHARPTPEGD